MCQAPLQRKGSIRCLSTRCAPRPGPISAPLAPPSPPADLHGGGSLEPASAAAAAFLAAFLAALARSNSRVRAGTILGSRRTRGGPAAPPPTRRGPPHRSTPAASAPHPLSTPLPSLTPPSPSISIPATPSPHRPSRLSSSHTPQPRYNLARGRAVALLCCGSFYVFSIKYENSILKELRP